MINTFEFTDIPSQPGKPKITKSTANSATFTWHTPDTDGGAPIKGYIVEKKERFGTRWLRVNKDDLVTECECTAYELAVGSEYQFRVTAENKAGLSKPSEPSDGITIKPPYGKYIKQTNHSFSSFLLKI